jgi:hypothetical protein
VTTMHTRVMPQGATGAGARGSRIVRWTKPGTVAIVSAAALATVACGAQTPNQTNFAATSQAQGQAPITNGHVMVNCGPGQQALIRPLLMNGQSVSQVDCVATGVASPAGVQAYAQPGYPQPGYAQPAYAVAQAAPTPTYVSYPESAPRAVPSARRVAYRSSGDYVEYVPPRRQGRTWKKSAVIIGSSAGIGAGVGAAISGKKGALIGAAIGGGGAAIWDQATRRDPR